MKYKWLQILGQTQEWGLKRNFPSWPLHRNENLHWMRRTFDYSSHNGNDCGFSEGRTLIFEPEKSRHYYDERDGEFSGNGSKKICHFWNQGV